MNEESYKNTIQAMNYVILNLKKNKNTYKRLEKKKRAKLRNKIDELQQENQSLKDRIEKAEEYINKIELDNYDTYIANILLDRNDDLLEILKGDK